MDSDAAPAVLDVILLYYFRLVAVFLVCWHFCCNKRLLCIYVSPLVWLDSGLVGLLQLSLVELVLGHTVSLRDPGGVKLDDVRQWPSDF